MMSTQRLKVFEKVAGVMGRALEHEVFEEVSKAALVSFFVFGTDVIPEVYRHDRQLRLSTDDDIQAVIQGGFRKRKVGEGVGF
jgi:hypothetical protein